MSDKSEQPNRNAKRSFTVEQAIERISKLAVSARKEFELLRGISLITPYDEAAFKLSPIEIDLPKKNHHKDKELRELERKHKHEKKCAAIRKFLEMGRELKRGKPESKLFKMSEELLDYLNRIESDPRSLSEYEWKKLDTDLSTYASLLRGEAERAKKPVEQPSQRNLEERQHGEEQEQATPSDTIIIDLNAFSESGSYRLLKDLLSDSNREGISIDVERHGKRQPKDLKELLRKKDLQNVAKAIVNTDDRVTLSIPVQSIAVTPKKSRN